MSAAEGSVAKLQTLIQDGPEAKHVTVCGAGYVNQVDGYNALIETAVITFLAFYIVLSLRNVADAGFGKAVAQLPDFKAQTAAMKALNAYARERLSAIPGLRFNSGEAASDYILNIYVPTFMTSQTVVQHLSSEYGICVSSGSACAKGKKSHVLTAMHLDDSVIEHSVRISFSRDTKKEDIDALADALVETVRQYPL